MLDSLEARTRTAGPALVRFIAGAGPTAEERRAAAGIVARIERDLEPGFDVDALKGEVKQLNASMTRSADSFDAAGMVAALTRALAERSEAAFHEAVRRILSDEAPDDVSRIYVPSVPQLVSLTKAIELEWSVAAERLRRIMAAEEENPPEPEPEPALTQEERADLERRIAALGSKMPAPDRPAPTKLDGKSPAAPVAAMTAARKAERLRQAERAGSLGKDFSENGQLLSGAREQAGNAD